jgi:hypothetical protein
MTPRILTGSLAAAVFAAAVGVGAQTTGQQPKATGEKSTQTFTVTGCVQKETDVVRSTPVTGQIGMGDEFVLTHSMLKLEGAAAEKRPAETGTPAGTTGTMPSTFGKVYRVTGDKEADLKNYVGQRIEIVGYFKHEQDARRELSPAGPPSGAAPAPKPGEQKLAAEQAPEVIIQSIRPATGSCAGAEIK